MELADRIKEKIKRWLRKKPLLHILSDSHGEVFKHIDWTKLKLKPSYCIVHGATASGLANPNSQTKALPIFTRYLEKRVKRQDIIIFQLGEIDCGFTIWLRAEKKNFSIAEQFRQTIESYSNLLATAQLVTSKSIILTSAILPTIEDGQDLSEVANLRKDVGATQLERTKLTIEFNRSMKDICIKNNYTFIDLDKELLNTKTMLVDNKYKNCNKFDHHLDPTRLASLLSKKLVSVLK